MRVSHVSRARITLGLLGLVLFCACADHGRAGLIRALTGRGALAVVGSPTLLGLQAEGTNLRPASSWPPVARALAAADPAALALALSQAQLQGIVVETGGASAAACGACLQRSLATYARVAGLQAVFLSPLANLYVLDPMRDWPPALRSGMAVVARRLLSGAPAPRMESFPERVRQVEPVEVMVLLRSSEPTHQARLWRSARGSSFARALLTAAEVARKRWQEREQAMGGSLDALLPRLDVEVSLLQDDGELGVRDSRFVDSAVTAAHGVAYEHKGAWRYLLPDDTHKSHSTPSAAYRRLCVDDGLPDSALQSDELRLYRVAVQPVGSSPAPQPAGHTPADAISGVVDPAEVLGH